MAKAMKKLRVLWMEDETPIRDFCKIVFQEAGWLERVAIHFVQDGDEAARELERAAPEIFITDVEHPGKPFDVLLAELEAKKVSFPILVVTAASCRVIKDFTDDRCPNLKIGFIQKPFGFKKLSEAFEEAYAAAMTTEPPVTGRRDPIAAGAPGF